MPHLVRKMKGFPLKVKSFPNTATYQKLRGVVPSTSLYHSGGMNLHVRPRVKFIGRHFQTRNFNCSAAEVRVVTWYMGSGLKAQNMTGIRAQRKRLRAQKNEIRDHTAFKPESGIIFITRSKNLLSQYFSA